MKVHKDSHNKFDSVNATIGLGDYQDGGLWIHDDDVGQDGIRKKLPNGFYVSGKVHDTRHKLVKFNPKVYHSVEKWGGDRWSVTAYTNRACHKLSEEQMSNLRRLGFVVQKQSLPTSPAPKPVDPDDDLTLAEFHESDKTKPKIIPPRTKPEVKTKPAPKKEEKKVIHPPEEIEDADYLAALLDEATDVEAEVPSGSVRPPKGPAISPDVGAEAKVTEASSEVPPPPLPPAEDAKRKRGIEALKKEAKSAHHLLCHPPKNPYCDICQQAKMYKSPSYSGKGVTAKEAKDFGDHITADHVVLYRDNENIIEDSRLALVIKDVATTFMQAYPSALKSEEECYRALTHFTSNRDNVGLFYSDNAKELVKTVPSLGWRHELSKAYIHQSNAVAERAVRSSTEGTRTNLLQAGLSHVYWPHRFEVPKGDYVFPLKERAEKVRLGGATDALERPVLESLRNQDAEEVEPGPNGSGEEVRSEPMVVDPKTGKMVPIPSGGMYYDAGGTLGRRYGGARGSRKPDSIPSYLWTAMSKKQKDQAVEEASREAALEALEGERSSASNPSVPAAFNKDFWEIRGDKLVRFHCIPRREKFSPDLTDCPIDVAHLSEARYTKIVPIGGTNIINHEDDWHNIRTRNKKYSFKWIGQTFFDVRKDSQHEPSTKDYPSMPVLSEPEAEPEHRES